MWGTVLVRAIGALQLSRMIPSRHSSTVSAAVNSMILRSLKDHYVEVSKMTPPPKVNPPEPFKVVSGAFDSGGPVLKRTYGDEEINISVMRMVNFAMDSDEGDDEINQLFLHADISKPGQDFVLHFLCGLYTDALGIHSVSLRHKLETSQNLSSPTRYNGPEFEYLDDRMRDALHGYVEERGIDHNLFPFLQAWLYVKDHRNLMRWFKAVGTCINDRKKN